MTEERLPNLQSVQAWVETRVSGRRLNHISGVVETATLLAVKCGTDPFRAQLAGWLHDACKEDKEQFLLEQARQYGLNIHPVEAAHGHLLHGPVAAELVKHRFGIDDEEILDAIRQHTLGGVAMNLLAKIVFLADAAEPGRPKELTQPIWCAIEKEKQLGIDKALNLAVRVACDLSLEDLIRQGRVIHPQTVAVRNYYLELTSFK